MHWYYDVQGMDVIARFMIRETAKSDINVHIKRLWTRHANRLIKIFASIDKMRLPDMQSEQLLSLYRTLITTLEHESAFGTMSDFLSSDIIPKAIRNYLLRIGIEKEYVDEWIGISTISLFESPYHKEQQQFFSIAAAYRRRYNIEKQCARYIKMYWYIQNDYGFAKKLDVHSLRQRVKDFIHDGHDPLKALQKLHTQRATLTRKKRWLIREAAMRGEVNFVKLLRMIDVHVQLWDLKKVMMQQSFYYMNIMLRQIGRQFHVPFSDMQWYIPREVENLLAHRMKPLSQRLITTRKKICVLEVTQRRTRVLVGPRAQTLIRNIEGSLDTKEKIIAGTVGNAGVVRGIVSIILNPRLGKKFKKGTILVTGMTTPDFIPLMRVAAAIITDEGGMTCHAAIVARELGIPCVIGTKIATKVLQDGDMVEVDATGGIVRKIK
ncbi:hypothetical protein HY624_02330 [Candidatus Uhrbacteria bacterium]|nr:hypothetical protein [Candidatus Uhrbacteria bacterium]